MIYRQTALYKFLYYCNESPLEKKVVDCGAGGNMPPLGLFFEAGYETIGIEMDEQQIQKAEDFAKKHGMALNIRQGDIRQLPFKNEEIPYLYSFGTIFHMSKKEVRHTIEEIKRVLMKEGLCYINLLGKEDFRCGQGIQIGDGEYLQEECGMQIPHAYFEVDEADEYFKDMEILYKENRIYERIYEGEKIRQASIDYIVKKIK